MDPSVLREGLAPDEIDRLVGLVHRDPHHVLGAHPVSSGVVVRAFRPDAVEMRVLPDDPNVAARQMERIHPAGLFATCFEGWSVPFRYRLEVRDHRGQVYAFRDAYVFLPTLGDLDLHLIAQGKHWRLYEVLGAQVRTVDGISGVSFAVWAPNARRVSVVGDWNGWDGRYHLMRLLGSSGIWELFIPDVSPGARYKYEIVTFDGRVVLKQDPLAFQTELRPGTAAVVRGPLQHPWTDQTWMTRRATQDPLRSPMSIYEVHLGSWMRVPEEGHRWLTYRELAPKLADYVEKMGFTHVELLPIAEHPYDGSWGYQVTGYYAPTARYGTPDDFRALVDELHGRGIGVILDWVPAHFPRDEWSLARFDGTALYEHADPRQGEHPDWGTLVFNYGRHEVRNFLIANALYWLDVFHVDGLRVDAVASMLYLDYSRRPGEWVPNRYGGRENLEAIEMLRELNELVHAHFPGTVTIAEESTAWPGVSRPTYVGGLGFTFKWNMGWMHDTLKYFSLDPIYRRYHHNQLTFGLMYAFSENFVLPLSHDEVVHMKGSLIGKMSGDPWQKFANLRALLGYMWCHPGKKLLFMGGEFAQLREWNYETSLDWHLLNDPRHAGVATLVRDLNRFYREHPELWEADTEPAGFEWIVVHDSEQSVAAFARFDRTRMRHVVCVLNATPVVRYNYRMGVPAAGYYREAINTDGAAYGGSNVGNYGGVTSRPVPSHGFPYSIELTLPPLAVLILEGPQVEQATDTLTSLEAHRD